MINNQFRLMTHSPDVYISNKYRASKFLNKMYIFIVAFSFYTPSLSPITK